MATIPQEDKAEDRDRVQFRVDADLYERIRIQAIRRRISVNQLCTEAVSAYLDGVKSKSREKA